MMSNHNKTAVIFLAALVLAIGGYVALRGGSTTTATPSEAAAVVQKDVNKPSRSTSVQSEANGIQTSSGQPSRPAESASKQYSLSKDQVMNDPKAWMLAYSKQDVAWLAQYNYPTLEEEAKLEAASDEALLALVVAGDSRARTHYGLRLLNKAISGKDVNAAEGAYGTLSQAIATGGPYEAAKIIHHFYQHAVATRELEPADEQSIAVYRKVYQAYTSATLLSAAFDDTTVLPLTNSLAMVNVLNRHSMDDHHKNTAMRSVMLHFSNLNSERIAAKLPPFSIVPRPMRMLDNSVTIYPR
jgi:hypothetical protein